MLRLALIAAFSAGCARSPTPDGIRGVAFGGPFEATVVVVGSVKSDPTKRKLAFGDYPRECASPNIDSLGDDWRGFALVMDWDVGKTTTFAKPDGPAAIFSMASKNWADAVEPRPDGWAGAVTVLSLAKGDTPPRIQFDLTGPDPKVFQLSGTTSVRDCTEH